MGGSSSSPLQVEDTGPLASRKEVIGHLASITREGLHLDSSTNSTSRVQVRHLTIQVWIHRSSSGSTPWMLTEVVRYLLLSSRGPWSMATGLTSARRPAGS